jgi:hypothetical protein
LKLKDKHVALARSLDKESIQVADLPKEEVLRMAHLVSMLEQFIGSLDDTDEEIEKKEITDVVDMLDALEPAFDQHLKVIFDKARHQ